MDLNWWDISNDLMLSRRSKTKNISNGCEGQEQLREMSDMDKDYKWFVLTSLSEAENFKSLKREREILDSTGDKSERISVADPQYELFLGRLKLCEKSYMLEVEKNGVPVVIKYEELGSSEDICVSKLQNEKKNCTGQKNVFVNEKPSLADNWATKNQVEREVKARPGKKVQWQNDLQEQLNDKGNVRSRHEIQTRDVKSNTHRNLRSTIKFHSEDNGGEDLVAVKLSTANEKDSEDNGGEDLVAVKLSTANENDSEDNGGEDLVAVKLSTANEKDGGKNNKKKKDNESASDLQEQLNDKGNVRSRQEIQTRDVKSNTHRNLRSTIKFHSGDNGGEDLEAVKLSTANEKDGGKNNKKKKDNESASDFEALATTEFCKKGNYVSVSPSTKLDNSSEFRNKVINIMRKPYNREEYDELRQAVKAQKTEENNGENSRGKSYLDYYPDLHRKLKKFENDRRRNLKTLRGFFFWLEHMTMEGSFKPWKDPECCAVEREIFPPPRPPASQRQSGKRRATSLEPGDDFESIGAGQDNCLPPLPPASSKPRNHHESDAVEKCFCQSSSPTQCRGRKRQMSLSNDPEMEQESRSRKILNSSKCGEDPKSRVN